jgi:NADH:ubiquinone oxidoreductase subunit 6 (subunit J)
MIALACPFGAAFLFEFIFSILALVIHEHPILQGNPYYVVLGISWLIMPISGIGFWSRNEILDGSIMIFIVGFVIWVLIGFPILSGFKSNS